jgi:cell division protein FtsZ
MKSKNNSLKEKKSVKKDNRINNKKDRKENQFLSQLSIGKSNNFLDTENNKEQKIKKIKIRIIGIGGGGGNIVSEMSSRIKNVSFVAANTDIQALKELNNSVIKFSFGSALTHGLGTGMNFELGKNAALSEKDKIKKLFLGYDFCVLISSLGGGVGSGSSPVFAKIAKSLGVLTLGIFTLPFKFEGPKKEEIALSSLQELRNNLNAFIVIPNDMIFRFIEKKSPLKDVLSFMNKNLSDSLEGLIDIINQPGIINIDFADLKSILQGYGKLAYLNTAFGQGDNRAQEAVKLALNSSLYPYSINGAKRVLFSISGDKDFSISEMSEISKSIAGQVSPGAQIIFGINQSYDLKNKVKISVLATGCIFKDFLKIKSNKETQEGNNNIVEDSKKATPLGKDDLSYRNKSKVKYKKRSSKKHLRKKDSVQKKEEVGVKTRIPVIDTKQRKSALEVQKDISEMEREIIEKEKFWDTPPFLRKEGI